MALKLSSLHQIESVLPEEGQDDGKVLVVVKLVEGARAPNYLNVREKFGREIISAEIAGRDLSRLGRDPAVASFQRSESMPLIN